MKKFVLVPEAKHRHTLATAATSENRDILQSIQRPEEREMLKRYHLAQDVLHDARRNGSAKMDAYREAMQDFSLLRDRRGGVRPQPRPVAAHKREDDDAMTNNAAENDDAENDAAENDAAENDATVVDVLPVSQKGNAQKLLRLLREHGDGAVSWTRNGEVSIRGQRLRGTNIVDLVGDVVRSSPSKRIAPQREWFLSALADANVPETLVKNKTALERYREIKTDGAVTMHDDINDAAVSSTTSPLDNEVESSMPEAKKKKRAKAQAVINWTAPL